ncbi:hypothetical protein [Aeribacillus kexueae]
MTKQIKGKSGHQKTKPKTGYGDKKLEGPNRPST